MKVLVSNDDSHNSPLLDFLLTHLQQIAEVSFVVPAHEQSWRGKSITRFEPLHIQEMELFGVKGWALDGTPADCVNAAIYNILDSPPDLVISGINAGMNAGLSFILSSGTVGACFEANIAGIPGIALSQQFDAAVHRHYVAEYALPADVLERLRGQTDVALSLVFDSMLKPILDAGEPMTWNVNIPFLLTDEEALWRADPGQTFYHQLFERDGNRLHHNLVECTIDSDIASDAQTIRDGRIAVTPLDFRCFGAALPASAQKLASKYLKEVSK